MADTFDRSPEHARTSNPFPIFSTSVETPATKRLLRVLARTGVADLIGHAGVFACRKIAGSTSWSDHSWGAAADLFPKPPTGDDDVERRRIFHAVIYQATHRTTANRGRKLDVRYVIDHDARLIAEAPSFQLRAYHGTTGDHVHVSTGERPTGTPPCAT